MKRGLWQRLKRAALTDVSVLARGVPRDVLEQFEQVLAEADFGPFALDLSDELEDAVRRRGVRDEAGLRNWLVDRIVSLFPADPPPPMIVESVEGPVVYVMLGVNGVGKTTQLAKLARWHLRHERSVLVAAADTYRAGAAAQLQTWADRLEVPCVTGAEGADPASVAFDAVEAGRARNIEVILVDTAGRLHTQTDLMTELQKVVRVIGKRQPDAPHEALLVVDGTVGQNALAQGETFARAVPLTGIIVTKLDGTAKGGSLVNLQRQLDVPLRFVGVGEGEDDLEPFDPRRFAERIVGA